MHSNKYKYAKYWLNILWNKLWNWENWRKERVLLHYKTYGRVLCEHAWNGNCSQYSFWWFGCEIWNSCEMCIVSSLLNNVLSQGWMCYHSKTANGILSSFVWKHYDINYSIYQMLTQCSDIRVQCVHMTEFNFDKHTNAKGSQAHQ